MTALALDLDALDALASAATEGPWRQEYAFNNAGCPTAFFYIPGHNGEARVEMLADDAAFIAAAREAVPALVAEVRRLRAMAYHRKDQLRMHQCIDSDECRKLEQKNQCHHCGGSFFAPIPRGVRQLEAACAAARHDAEVARLDAKQMVREADAAMKAELDRLTRAANGEPK